MKKSLFAAAAVAVSLFSAQAMAETWVVHSEPEFPPYNFPVDGKHGGMDTEIIERVLAELGVEADHKLVPWARVVASVDENTTDLAYQFAPRPERFEMYHMVGPHRAGQTIFLMNKDKVISYETLEDLKDYKIGTVIGYAYTPEFDEAAFLQKEPVKDNETNIKKLAAGRLDLVIGDRATLAHIAKSEGVYEQLQFSDKVLKEVPRYIAFPKAKGEKAEKFAAKLEELKASGEIQKIIDKWSK